MICNIIDRLSLMPLDSRKQIPAIGPAAYLGAAAIGGLGNVVQGLFGSSAQEKANETNIMLAREGRDWQSAENQKARDWQLEMWNRQNEYNTPANQRRLAQEAGYNPYLLGNENLGSGAGSAGVPGMSGAPDVAHVSPVNPMQGLGAGVGSFSDMVRMLPQVEQVESNKKLQSSEIVKNLTDSIIDAYDKLGSSGASKVWDKIAPFLKSLDLTGSRSDIVFSEFLKNNLSQRYNLDMDSLNKEIEYNLGKKYGEQRIQSNLEKLDFEISEIVGRLNTMHVQNEALIKQTGADLAVKAAHAFMLIQEGNKFAADAKTANQLRQYLKKAIKHKAELLEIDSYFGNARKESNSELVGFATSQEGRHAISESYRIPLVRHADALWTAADNFFTNHVKLNSGGSAGSYGSFESGFSSENGSTLFGW